MICPRRIAADAMRHRVAIYERSRLIIILSGWLSSLACLMMAIRRDFD